jgi:hypothetical protein
MRVHVPCGAIHNMGPADDTAPNLGVVQTETDRGRERPKNPTASAMWSVKKEGPSPSGANDPQCRPDKVHPNPVLLVSETRETMPQTWSALSPLLAEK